MFDEQIVVKDVFLGCCCAVLCGRVRSYPSETHDNTTSSFEARVDYIPALSLAFFLVEGGEWVRSRAHFLILQINIYSGVS